MTIPHRGMIKSARLMYTIGDNRVSIQRRIKKIKKTTPTVNTTGEYGIETIAIMAANTTMILTLASSRCIILSR